MFLSVVLFDLRQIMINYDYERKNGSHKYIDDVRKTRSHRKIINKT